MQQRYGLALALTLAMSATAVLWPGTQPGGPTDAASTTGQSLPPVFPAFLDQQLSQPLSRVAQAASDPFGYKPVVAVAAPAVLPVLAPVPPTPVEAPPHGYRYLGQFFDPKGHRIVYLLKNDRDLAVTVGTNLDDGYVVREITERAVKVEHAPTQTLVDIPIPANPTGTAAP